MGYVVGSARRGYTFYGPDPDGLLSDSFLETQCFSAPGGGGADSGFVGLAFEPAPDRRLPDIRGVLWLDALDYGLRTLEFEYTRPPAGLPTDAGGGYVGFMSLPAGTWIVSRWWIRMAHLVWAVGGSFPN